MERILARKRYQFNLLDEMHYYEEIISLIEKEHKLREDGKENEADLIQEERNNKLMKRSDILRQELDILEKKMVRKFDKSILPKENEILVENEVIVLRAISKDEYEQYKQVAYECSITGAEKEDENKMKALFGSYMAEHNAYYSIIEKISGNFVGYIALKDFREEVWDIAIEILSAYRHIGYGYNAMNLFLDTLSCITGEHTYKLLIDPDNYASQGLADKIGAKPVGLCEYTLHGELLERFKKVNHDLIDDKLRGVANIFGVEPEELLGTVLEYKIEWKMND